MTDTDQHRENEMPRQMEGARPKPHMTADESIELRQDADERFRAAVRAAAKSGPKHRAPKA